MNKQKTNIFAAHGEFNLCLSNNILLARISGSWNLECAINFSEQFKQMSSPLQGKPWGHLVYLDDWELSAPEVFPVITDLVVHAIANGLEKSAQVYNESMAKKMFLDKMVVEKLGSFERQVFVDDNLALQWLNSSGFTLTRGVTAKDVV